MRKDKIEVPLLQGTLASPQKGKEKDHRDSSQSKKNSQQLSEVKDHNGSGSTACAQAQNLVL